MNLEDTLSELRSLLHDAPDHTGADRLFSLVLGVPAEPFTQIVRPYVDDLIANGPWAGEFIPIPSQHQRALHRTEHTPQLGLVTHLEPGTALTTRQMEVAVTRPEMGNLRSFYQPGRYAFEEGDHSLRDVLRALFDRPPAPLHRIKITDASRDLPILTELFASTLYPRLDTLELNGLTVYDTRFAEALDGVTLPRDTSLSFARVYNRFIPNSLDAADTSALRALSLQTYGRIQHFETQTPLVDAALAVLEEHGALESLSFGYPGLGSDDITALATSPHVATLRRLTMKGDLRDEDLARLVASPHLDGLTHLDLSSANLPDFDRSEVFASARLPALNELTIINPHRNRHEKHTRARLSALSARGVAIT